MQCDAIASPKLLEIESSSPGAYLHQTANPKPIPHFSFDQAGTHQTAVAFFCVGLPLIRAAHGLYTMEESFVPLAFEPLILNLTCG